MSSKKEINITSQKKLFDMSIDEYKRMLTDYRKKSDYPNID